jgi:hypothetical protein
MGVKRGLLLLGKKTDKQCLKTKRSRQYEVSTLEYYITMNLLIYKGYLVLLG